MFSTIFAFNVFFGILRFFEMNILVADVGVPSFLLPIKGSDMQYIVILEKVLVLYDEYD